MLLPNDMEVVMLDDRLRPMKEWALVNTAAGEWQAYIVAEPGRSFAIQLGVKDRSKEDLTADIWLNGGAKKSHTVKFPAGAPRQNIVRGIESGSMLHPFVFSKLDTTEEIADACEDTKVLGSMGEICVTSCPYDTRPRKNTWKGGEGGGRDPSLPNADLKFYEKNKKLMTSNLRVGFGQAEQLGGRGKGVRGFPAHVYVRKDPVYKIRFLPRTEYALERSGIIEDPDEGVEVTGSSRRPSGAKAEGSSGSGPNGSPKVLRRKEPGMQNSASFSSSASSTAHAESSRSSLGSRVRERSKSPEYEVVDVKREKQDQKRSRRVFAGPGRSAEEPLEIPDNSEDECPF
ncbi:unnamed protein product [Tilletia controversa]|uniref:DUF7918 domain-containing protein n=3 Tax=Tilletia TaxID=13289 RepID=A0A8X7MUN7_9BASI|nr:hypothetical protein CF336_g6373 [Tilletia laevis]KAE8190575.1 hypothetical protein CF328_g5933 [Tilletia controversa]KAE8256379.1 hypothetical protein A4X03_0g5408 [Tilletia caries]KAE8192982.1 hypothetical protein CF335_g5706 [Tilletia laevis]KAE8249214.1 hypothetical protein A4X06_0g3332 [Tilletia controversa]